MKRLSSYVYENGIFYKLHYTCLFYLMIQYGCSSMIGYASNSCFPYLGIFDVMNVLLII